MPINKIAVLGNHLPRQCGIATYTTDLSMALRQYAPASEVFVLAMDDIAESYAYPEQVRFALSQNDIHDYRRSADALNLANIDLLCVQHEYGIFGGRDGSHVLELLRDVQAPVVTTLHTVLREPSRQQRKVLIELARLSDRLVVMSERGAAFLQDIYGIAAEKIDIIPHGIPDVPFLDPSFYKDSFNVEGKTVLLTFGLLSRNKGIENVIAALPDIVEQHPDVVYIVLGATHPNVRKHDGEEYREMLQRMAQELGVAEHVIFYDEFVEIDELIRFINAADMYITPYLNEAQIVSGTLAYTLGAGKAIVSTPYWYAEEMLADGRGVLVPFRDPGAMAEQVLALLDNEGERHAMRKRAYLHGREMIWPEVAQRYMAAFERARDEHRFAIQRRRPLLLPAADPGDLPEVRLDHLQRMTDSTGLIQHAVCGVPNYNEGYTTDDNARGLIAGVLLEEMGAPEATGLSSRYMAFLWHAFNADAGRFRNFMTYDRRWLEAVGSEDSHARSLWAASAVLARSADASLRGVAAQLFERALPGVVSFEHPRPWAISLLGLDEYLRFAPGDRVAQRTRATLAVRLFERYEQHRGDDWRWFADGLTYDNAIMPHALLVSGAAIGDTAMRDAGLEALRWLADIQTTEEGHFAPVGCHGFCLRGELPARFDQQPLEAQAMVLAALDAHRVSGDKYWLGEAQRAFGWFLGHNDLRLPLYNPATGGCFDGLLPDRVNQNQGAESTLACLIALLALRNHAAEQGVLVPMQQGASLAATGSAVLKRE